MTELTDRELTIMRALWADGPMTAQEIGAALPGRPDNSTVRTFLRILEQKGHIAHSKRGRQFVFRAKTSHDQAARQALGALLDGYFGGSFQALLQWKGPGKPTIKRRPRKSAPRVEKSPPAAPPPNEPESQETWLL